MPDKPEKDVAQLEVVAPPPALETLFSSGQPQQTGSNETISPALPQYLTSAGGLSEIPSTAALADYLKHNQRPENALLLAALHREETRSNSASKELGIAREENTQLKVENGTLVAKLDHERDFKKARTLLLALSSISNGYGIKLMTDKPANLMGIVYLGIGILLGYLSIFAFGNNKNLKPK